MTLLMPSKESANNGGSSVPSLGFREASFADLDLLAVMNAELLTYELGSAPPVERLRAQLESFFAQGARATVMIILGMPAGYALHNEGPDLMHLQHFLIRAPWRGMGLGAAFLRHLESALESPKPIQVEALLSNGKGLAFWRSHGFGDFYLGLRKNPVAADARG